MIAVELLKQQRLLGQLDPGLLEKLRHHVVMREFPKRSFVLREGQPGDSLLMLFAGRLQVITISEKGKEVGINFIEPGDHFGEISLIDGQARSASVVSLTTSVVGFLPKAQALWLFYHNPTVAEQVQLRLCQTIRKEIEYRSTLSGSKAYNRIYAVICNSQISGHQKSAPTAPTQTIEGLPTQQSIASMANVSRETVSRAIQALVKAGVIQKQTKRLVVRDPRTLQLLANGDLSLQDIRRMVGQEAPSSRPTPAESEEATLRVVRHSAPASRED
jgi:CRP-like cAMP-binding protein